LEGIEMIADNDCEMNMITLFINDYKLS